MKNEFSIREDRKVRKLFRKIDQIDKLIDFWNSLDHVAHHKKGTYTYKKIKHKLQLLLDGKFTIEYTIDSKFAKRAGISNTHKKYTVVQIQNIMIRLAQLCSPGYTVNKYDYTPKQKGLDYLLYCSSCNSSYFLLVEATPPKLCANRRIDLNNLPFDEQYLEDFLNMMSYAYAECPEDVSEVALGIESLINLHKKTEFNNPILDSLNNFLYAFKSFLRETYKEIKPYMINNQTFIRKNFRKYLERNYNELPQEK